MGRPRRQAGGLRGLPLRPQQPGRTDGKQGHLRYLTADPRRLTQAQFLVRPDHRLSEQECRACTTP